MKFLLLSFMIFSVHAVAGEVDMRDYIKIRNGMTEAEILYLLGPYDHETIKSDRYDYIFDKTWYYIPAQGSNGKWITEVRFNSSGELIDHDRYRTPR